LIDWGLTPRETQIAQLLVLIAVAVFISGRFLPPRFRQPVGFGLTVCYLAAVGAFMVWVLMR
jgi:hypothetical protein